ncbi:DUF2834 domain-containing protein [Chromatocurvus halotolerans]|uniref:Uncharacterized protein DUF2834 n=1 Tax=Chromatocurvus halotolerans TaxID=1132028 RepID=A0A4R2KB81_9GAMM|nr:DUF2834 domain-containing protein [Chromatocurvus halotolerans]TCO69472.1 uncharacterized protein DUF2834 [Chromatocurvus halotolerans]
MSESVFKAILALAALFFTGFFALIVVPPLIENPDIWGAFAAGFVNPYSSGYSTDVLVCWTILAAWVFYEAKKYSVRKGWVCLLLGIVPGVAVGFALYLLLRGRQIREVRRDA